MTAVMKALILHQPYATLVALGVKRWETRGAPPNGSMRPAGVRGMPGLAIEPGERIAICAGAKVPAKEAIGDWNITNDRAPSCLAIWRNGCPTETWLPLGRVVCTAVVAEALPVVEPGPVMRPPAPTKRWVAERLFPALGLAAWGVDGAAFVSADISDQLPYGDWTPGRWAWRLTDAEPVQSRPAPEVTRGNRQGVCEIKETW